MSQVIVLAWDFIFIYTMKLLKYENYVVSPSEEIFLVKPFRDLYNADDSPNKEAFMQQLSVIYFMIDPRSSYQDIADEEDRLNQIKEQEGLSSDYTITPEITRAMEIYKKLTTTTSQKLLDSMRKSIAKIGEFLENVDLYKTDEKTGKPVYTVSSVVQATDKIPVLAKKLIETEKIVDSEITEVGRARGGNETKSLFEDGI